MSQPLCQDRGEFLQVYFTSGQFALYHYFWLRHNCPCCVHPTTRERILCPAEVPLAIRPRRIDSEGGSICIDWDDGHQSVFAVDWLAGHQYAADQTIAPIEAGDPGLIQVQYDDCAGALVRVCQDYLQQRGAILVRACQLDTEELIDQFTQGGYRVRETHFGRIEDLRTDNTTNDNTDQLGYTNAAVELHTDQPFIEEPPRLQILYCMRRATSGGESLLADALQAAHYLRDLDRHAFAVLTETPVLFDRRQKEFSSQTSFPILTFAEGQFVQIRSSYFTLAPQALPFDQMEQWYRAYQKFTRLIEQPEHQFNFALEPRDFILYDNYRMLHGRRAFSGPRWMRGIYLDEE
ncbi:MAG: DUF971 domain-containing protein [Candidatus Latescibacteria bacterium]|nr:DUF971 domain-containing protein [Candidatus Latescibacterota bacterium]